METSWIVQAIILTPIILDLGVSYKENIFFSWCYSWSNVHDHYMYELEGMNPCSCESVKIVNDHVFDINVWTMVVIYIKKACRN